MTKKSYFLKAGTQKVLKWIHITCVAFSTGGLVSILILLFLKRQFGADDNLFLIDLSVFHLFNSAVTYYFYGILFTGLLYSLFTKWGFVKHYWIIFKWISVLILFVLIWVWVGPAINGSAALSEGQFFFEGAKSQYLDYSLQGLLFTAAVTIILFVLILVSVFKPWGQRKLRFKIKRKSTLIIAASLAVIALLSLLMQSISLIQYRSMSVADSDLTQLRDGFYFGKSTMGGFTYSVEAKVTDHTIENIKIISNRESPYARFAEAVIPRIKRNNNANVDTITGATTTSKCLMKAVENALEQK